MLKRTVEQFILDKIHSLDQQGFENLSSDEQRVMKGILKKRQIKANFDTKIDHKKKKQSLRKFWKTPKGKIKKVKTN